jgi:mono/diheme cytochrome c family protein
MRSKSSRLFSRRTTWWRRPDLRLLALAGMVSLLAMACSTGAYPFDLMAEMHYNQAYRSQEPPRLDAHAEAVPISLPGTSKNGAELYTINCAMCHGQSLRGNGPVLTIMQEMYDYRPLLNPDLISDVAQSQSDPQLAGIISGGVNAMPSFRKLLTETEIRLVISYLRQQAMVMDP